MGLYISYLRKVNPKQLLVIKTFPPSQRLAKILKQTCATQITDTQGCDKIYFQLRKIRC